MEAQGGIVYDNDLFEAINIKVYIFTPIYEYEHSYLFESNI